MPLPVGGAVAGHGAGGAAHGAWSQAQLFVDTVPAPKHGEMVPEAILFVFELAHDLLERDHP